MPPPVMCAIARTSTVRVELAAPGGHRCASARGGRRRRSARRARPGCRPGRCPPARAAAAPARSRLRAARSTAGRRWRRPRSTPAAGRRARAARRSPTQNPARSNSPGRVMSGSSAVSPPSRAQPTSRQPAAMPSTSVGDHLDVDLAAGDDVQEEGGPAARCQHVVDAHGDEISAQSVRAGPPPRPAAPSCRRRRCRRRSAGRRTDGSVEAGEAAVAAEHLAACVEATAARMRSTTASAASRLTPEPAYVSGGGSSLTGSPPAPAPPRSAALRGACRRGSSVGYIAGQAGAAEAVGRAAVVACEPVERQVGERRRRRAARAISSMLRPAAISSSRSAMSMP